MNKNKNKTSRRNRRVSPQTRSKISRGVEESWKKRGAKYAAGGLATLATGAALYKNRALLVRKAGELKNATVKGVYSTIEKAGSPFRAFDRAISPSIEKFVHESLKKPPKDANLVEHIVQSFFPQQSMEAALAAKAKAVRDIKVSEVKQQVQKVSSDITPKIKTTVENAKQKTVGHTKAVIDTPKNTVAAVKAGYAEPTPSLAELRQSTKKGDKVTLYLAKQNARVRVRAQQDIEKVKRFRERFGFSQEDNQIGLIEFTQRRKRRTAAEKAAISQGLREYYATQPKPKKSTLDKVDRGALSVNRVTRATSNILSTAAMGLSLAGQLKAMTYKPSRGERVFQNVSAGAGLLSSLSGSYRGFGTGTRSLAGSANIYDDLRVGAKNRRFGLTEQRLGLERSKQVLAKDRAKSYRTIANASARANSPGGTKFEDMVTRRAKYDKTDTNTVKLNLRKKPKER
jgi:hypothetical protein